MRLRRIRILPNATYLMITATFVEKTSPYKHHLDFGYQPTAHSKHTHTTSTPYNSQSTTVTPITSVFIDPYATNTHQSTSLAQDAFLISPSHVTPSLPLSYTITPYNYTNNTSRRNIQNQLHHHTHCFLNGLHPSNHGNIN